MSRPTIYDVAQRAGVGIGTVSRVLNNSPKVSAATRELVMLAIRELSYTPNHAARQLGHKIQLRNIGVITQPFLSYRSFTERLLGVQSLLEDEQNRYELVLYSVSSVSHYTEQLRSIVRGGQVLGLLIIDLDLTPLQKEILTQANLPFIGLNNFQDRDWICIGTDNVEGGALATRYLLDLGHQRIAYVGDNFYHHFGFDTSERRFEGYRRALHERNIPLREEYVRLGEHSYETARALTKKLLQLPQPPTAIFAMSDIQALGCIATIREEGLQVPEDISVIGYDNLEISQHSGLSTVSQHLEQTGREGIAYLLRLLEEDDPGEPPRLPPIEVIPRQTTQRIG